MKFDQEAEMKCVIPFLVGLALIVLGSAIVDNNILDYSYFVFLIYVLIRYIYICKNY
jgi:hypothetical protein